MSDHISIYSCIFHPYSSSKTSNHYSGSSPSINFRKADFITIKSELMSTDWDAFLNNYIDGSVMLNNVSNLLITICNNYSPLYSHKKYKFPIHLKILLNKCRHLHKNINNSIGYVKWRKCQSEFDILLEQYFIDKENLVLNSNNKSLFYKYLNDKLHTSNSISPLLCSITNNIVTSDAVCLSRQFSSVFINNNITSINFPFIARPTPTINQFTNYPISLNNVRNVYVYCLINIITPLTCYQRLFKKKYPMKFVIPYRLYTPLFLNLELVLVFGKSLVLYLYLKKVIHLSL